MAHSIHVGFLSVNDTAIQMIQAITEKGILAEKNIHISDKHQAHADLWRDHAYKIYDDDAGLLIKVEVAVVTAPKRGFDTVLAPICAMTRGKIILSMTPGIDGQHILDCGAKGTIAAAANPIQMEDGVWVAHMEYSKGFPPYMKAPCVDIVGGLCQIIEE